MSSHTGLKALPPRPAMEDCKKDALRATTYRTNKRVKCQQFRIIILRQSREPGKKTLELSSSFKNTPNENLTLVGERSGLCGFWTLQVIEIL